MRKGPKGERIVHKAIDIGGRVPPHDLDAEAAVLASILADGRRYDEAAGVLKPGDWYADANRRVFESMADLRASGQPIDLQTVASWLKDRDWLQAIGGHSYLSKIIDSTPAIAHVAAYAKIISGKAHRRAMIDAAQLIAAEGFVWSGDDSAFVDFAARMLGDAVQAAEPDEGVTLCAAVDARMMELRDIWTGDVEAVGMQTRFSRYNMLTNGLHPGQMHTVAAITSGGKTAFAWQAALDIAGTEYHGELVGVVVVSCEMKRWQLVDRGIALEGQPRRRFLRKDPDHEIVVATEQASDILRGKAVVILDRATTIEGVRALVRNAQRGFDRARRPGEMRTRVRFVLIDYLQLMHLPDEREMRHSVGKFTAAFKQLSFDEEFHGMLVSQITRDVGKGARRPTVYDLKESGSIENDSDLITFVHRPIELVDPEERRSLEWQALEDYGELVLGKARDEARGVFIEVAYNGPRTRFSEPTAEQTERWKDALSSLRGKAASAAQAHRPRRGPYDAKPGAQRPPHS